MIRVHHFFPKTSNIGDFFVAAGIERLLQEVESDAQMVFLNVNARGDDRQLFGLTRETIDRANQAADLVIVGGSNLYEGSKTWAVHLETESLDRLHVALILLGMGTGSGFLGRIPHPSPRVLDQIKILNSKAVLSGVRDVTTLEWLRSLGIGKAEMLGDPATFVFNEALGTGGRSGHVLAVLPPSRFWDRDRRGMFDRRRRAMFRAFRVVALETKAKGYEVVVTFNDIHDEVLAHSLFGGESGIEIVFPKSTKEYFELLRASRAVIAGRLHSAVVALSLAIPFTLIDLDQRTHGFVRTYELDRWAARPTWRGFEKRLRETTVRMLDDDTRLQWQPFIVRRNELFSRCVSRLRETLKTIPG